MFAQITVTFITSEFPTFLTVSRIELSSHISPVICINITC
jgi:hypothetical protein